MSTDPTPDALPSDLLEHLLDTVTAAIPTAPDDTDQLRATRRQVARLALLALQPKDAFQAMLAAQAVAAHYAVMDNLKRAAQPDLAPAMAARLRANAASVARMMQAAIRSLQKQQAPAGAPRPTAQPPRRPLPHHLACWSRRAPAHRRPAARAPFAPVPPL